MDRWANQVAVITRASTGIGAAISEDLVEHGLRVVGIARGEEKLKELQKKLDGKNGKFYYFVGDVAQEEDIVDAFKWVKKNVGVVHILINSTGVAEVSPLMEGNSDHIKIVLNTNVFALSVATREALKEMKNNKIDGHIIHINSGAGHSSITRNISLNVYPASKHAVTALAETLRNELSLIESKIKISSISTGVVQTKLVEDVVNKCKLVNTTDKVVSPIKESFETAPILQSKDVSDAVVYLLSTSSHVQIHELIIRPMGPRSS